MEDDVAPVVVVGEEHQFRADSFGHLVVDFAGEEESAVPEESFDEGVAIRGCSIRCHATTLAAVGVNRSVCPPRADAPPERGLRPETCAIGHTSVGRPGSG